MQVCQFKLAKYHDKISFSLKINEVPNQVTYNKMIEQLTLMVFVYFNFVVFVVLSP